MKHANAHEETLITIHLWCDAMGRTIRDKDLEGHMALVSETLRIYGLPSKQVVDYAGYHKRRKHELRNDVLITLNYVNVRVVTSTQRRISFRAKEKLVGRDGTLVLMDKNIILEREDDGVWRMVEDKINHWDVKKLDIESLK